MNKLYIRSVPFVVFIAILLYWEFHGSYNSFEHKYVCISCKSHKIVKKRNVQEVKNSKIYNLLLDKESHIHDFYCYSKFITEDEITEFSETRISEKLPDIYYDLKDLLIINYYKHADKNEKIKLENCFNEKNTRDLLNY